MYRASDICKKDNRRVITSDDVFQAMRLLGFRGYVGPLEVWWVLVVLMGRVMLIGIGRFVFLFGVLILVSLRRSVRGRRKLGRGLWGLVC